MTPALTTRFADCFGQVSSGVTFAPGRVNLIGEHVDYNDGLVLPMPLSVGTRVAWRPNGGDHIDVIACDQGGERVRVRLDGKGPLPGPHWSTYVLGMAACMRRHGLAVAGADLVIAGDMPRGAGLSSSASLCIAVGRAIAAAAGSDVPDAKLMAIAAQETEREFAGVNCGIMDQIAVSCGSVGEPLLIDCRSLATTRVRFPPDWSVIIFQSGVRRGLVDGQYNQRRAACEAVVAALGGQSLRDTDIAELRSIDLPPDVAPRAVHVIEEIARVSRAVDAMHAEDIVELGRLMAASHASLRDLFDVSHPDVDRLVAIAQRAIGPDGGARMTGGGFGGAVVALVRRAAAAQVIARVRKEYRMPNGQPPDVMAEGIATTP